MHKKYTNLFIILLKIAFLLLCGAVFGTLLLTIVFSIPVDRILANYQSIGLASIGQRDGWHKYLVDYDASTLDNNTEWLMLKVSATPPPDTGENTLQRALRCYTLNNEWNHGLSFRQYEWKGQTYSCDSYERYWHGYAVLLKPLLCIFTYTDIVFINFAMQMFIMFFILHMLGKRNMKQLQMPFLFFWMAGMQTIVSFCLDYSVCFYIYAVSVLLLLYQPKFGGGWPVFLFADWYGYFLYGSFDVANSYIGSAVDDISSNGNKRAGNCPKNNSFCIFLGNWIYRSMGIKVGDCLFVSG